LDHVCSDKKLLYFFKRYLDDLNQVTESNRKCKILIRKVQIPIRKTIDVDKKNIRKMLEIEKRQLNIN
jgi:hypothetical protein